MDYSTKLVRELDTIKVKREEKIIITAYYFFTAIITLALITKI